MNPLVSWIHAPSYTRICVQYRADNGHTHCFVYPVGTEALIMRRLCKLMFEKHLTAKDVVKLGRAIEDNRRCYA